MISPRMKNFRNVFAAAVVSAALLSGCQSKNDAAIEQAKKMAASTGQAQQVIVTDKNGNVITTTVQPPVPGQAAQSVTTTVTPPVGGPAVAGTAAVPARNGEPARQGGYAAGQPAYANGQPATYANGQPVEGSAPPGSTYPAGQPAVGQPIIRPVDINIPAGTTLAIRINQHISVKTSHVGDRFTGEVVEPVIGAGDRVAIPKGTPVGGVIDASHKRGHFKGASILELRLTSLTMEGRRYPISTGDLTRTKKGKGKRSAAFIGGGAGLGALIGGLAGGGVGAVVGGAAGAGTGTAIGGLTGNRDIEIPAESIVRFRLNDNLEVVPE